MGAAHRFRDRARGAAVGLVATLIAGTAVVVASTGTTSASGVGSGVEPEIGRDPRPNIVLITTDDQTVADLAAMDWTRKNLVRQGTSFANSYTPFSLCCPDRASIMTGQYAHNHGVLGNGGEAFPEGGMAGFDPRSTIATWLSEAGYQTAMVGKYLNGYRFGDGIPPGWDDWHGGLAMLDYYNTILNENGARQSYAGQYQTDVLSQISTDVIESRVPDPRPLFLWTSYYAPHAGAPSDPDDPIKVFGRSWATPQVAERHRDRFDHVALPRDPSFNPLDLTGKPAEIRALPLLNDYQLAMAEESHQQRLESLLAVDEGIQSIVTALRETGELANTVIMFTSDNGMMIGTYRVKQGKVLPYEPSIRVPLVVRGPGFPAGVVRTQPTASMDLTSTIIDLSGARRGLPQDGLSLLDLATDPARGETRDIVLEAGPRTVGGPMFFSGLRTHDGWTYVEYVTGEVELYHTADDPYQLVNLAGTPAQANREAGLRNRLARMRDCAWAACLPAADRTPGPPTDPPRPPPTAPPTPTTTASPTTTARPTPTSRPTPQPQPPAPSTPAAPVPAPQAASTTVADLARQPRVGRRVVLMVSVVSGRPPDGTVRVRVRGRPSLTVPLVDGVARVVLGRFSRAGPRTVRVRFPGVPGTAGSRDVLEFRVLARN